MIHDSINKKSYGFFTKISHKFLNILLSIYTITTSDPSLRKYVLKNTSHNLTSITNRTVGIKMRLWIYYIL
jgi:hypothetical protein